jgi:hypothetical protein
VNFQGVHYLVYKLLDKKKFHFLKDSIFFASSNNELFEKKIHVCKFKLEFVFQNFCKTKKNGLLEKKKNTKDSVFELPKMEQDDEQEDYELK